MPTELEVKLLQLTRHGQRATFGDLANQLHTTESILAAKMAELHERELVSSVQGIVQLDTCQRIRLAEQLIQTGHDPRMVSRYLEWQEFENFAADSLEKNGFRTIKHLVFKTRGARREIDLLAWNDTFVLAIDCKHWLRGWSPSRVRKAAEAQIGRVVALAERSDLLRKHGVENVERRAIMPVIFALGDPRERMVQGVPVVSVSRLVSFLYGVSPVDERLRRVPVNAQVGQSYLLGYG